MHALQPASGYKVLTRYFVVNDRHLSIKKPLVVSGSVGTKNVLTTCAAGMT